MEKSILPKTGVYKKISDVSRNHPDRPAVYNAKGSGATYRDFVYIYDTLKVFLDEHSINPYDRITIITGNEIMMGQMTLPVIDNATLVPLDPQMDEDKSRFFYKLLDVDYILTDDLSSSGCLAAGKLGIGIIHFSDEGPPGHLKFNLERKPDKEQPRGKNKKSDLVMVNTTSGTTSTPKIVPTTKRAYKSCFERNVKHYEFNSDDNILIITKMFKSFSIFALLMTLYTGGTAILANGFNHMEFIRLLNIHKITTFIATPAVLSSFAGYVENNNINLENTSLRFVRSSGAPLSRKLKGYLEDIFHTPVIQSYGMTEVLGITSTYKEPVGYKEGSAGVSIGLAIRIVDDEIIVKGDTVFPGYENTDIDNNDYFTDGWFHTGDMGYVDDDGYIFITGRIKEMINKGGEKISPYEVESVIIKHPDVMDAAVFPYSNSYDSEDAGAVIVMHKGKELNLEGLRKFMKEKISAYKMPTILYTADEIPKSENNKVQRKKLFIQLKKLYPDQGKAENVVKEGKLTPTEKKLKKIWAKALKKGSIDIAVNFTEAGGDSLSGSVVLSEIENKFNIRIPVNILFEEGAIRTIAQMIDDEKEKGSRLKYLVPIKSSGNKKPLICVHSGVGDAVTYRFIGKHMEKDRPVYALRFETNKTKWPHPLTFDYLSRKYAEEIRLMDPEGPYYLCGHCWGGVLAFKIASTLRESGGKVGMLAMFDSASKAGSIKRRQATTEIKRKGSLFSSIKSAIGRSLIQMKDRTFREKLKYFKRKISNIMNFIRLTQSKKIYRAGHEKNIPGLMKISGRAGALGFAYQNYIPDFYNDKLHYFKSTKDKTKTKDSQKFWKGKARDFELIKMDCYHNDIVVGDDAKTLVGMLDKIMGDADA